MFTHGNFQNQLTGFMLLTMGTLQNIFFPDDLTVS
jgi:hypothetical protein